MGLGISADNQGIDSNVLENLYTTITYNDPDKLSLLSELLLSSQFDNNSNKIKVRTKLPFMSMVGTLYTLGWHSRMKPISFETIYAKNAEHNVLS